MKLTIFKYSFSIVLLSVFFFSCKKEAADTKPAYYVKFKMNGNWLTWKTVVGELGPDLFDNTKTNFGFNAISDDKTETFDLSFQVEGNKLDIGTYNSDDYFMPIEYSKDANSQSMQMYSLNSVSGRADSKYTVTLTSITDKEVKGTFAGNYLKNDFTDNETVDITEGEFVVPRIR